MMPLIDVVFLLLTFFIYSMVVMDRLKTAGVELLSVDGASQEVDEEVVFLEVDGEGGIWLGGDRVPKDELDSKLRTFASQQDPPKLILALQKAEEAIDRGPIVLDLQRRAQQAGVTYLGVLNLKDGSGVKP